MPVELPTDAPETEEAGIFTGRSISIAAPLVLADLFFFFDNPDSGLFIDLEPLERMRCGLCNHSRIMRPNGSSVNAVPPPP